jgi:hypothetical protein
MSSITIVWKPTGLLGTYHAFLLYNDGTNTYYARGGPAVNDGVTSGGSGSSGSGSGSGPGFGPIVVHHGLYEQGTPDFPKLTDPPGTFDSWQKQNVVSGEGLDLSQLWQNITSSMDRIQDAQIPYDPLSLFPKTSNSVVSSSLRDTVTILQTPRVGSRLEYGSPADRDDRWPGQRSHRYRV